MEYPNPYKIESHRVSWISLNWTDRIRLFGLEDLTEQLREAIRSGWGSPIQTEDNYHGAHEFKLKGNPWTGVGEEAVKSRRLLNSMFICMAQNGWNLIQSADVSKKEGDKDTLFFESSTPDPDAQIFSVSFNMGDRIRVVDAPHMLPYVKEAVETSWKKGIQKEKEYYGSMELKLSGSPWFATGGETVHARMLLMQILHNLRTAGFKLYASVDLSYGTEGRDIESWFFRKVGPCWQ